MSNLITGTHLKAEDLVEILGNDSDIRRELDDFGEWAKTKKFHPLNKGVEKCQDEDRDQKVRPILKKLGYENKVRSFYTKIERRADI
jgi:hypothetical protein